MKRLFIFLFLLNLRCWLIAQIYTTWPVPFQNLTGNYGEIRPNHFHAGLDFPIEINQNQAIYAAKAGYISRIKISPYGYGKVLYITHYDGKLTVYAHQKKFKDSLEAYVKREQLKRRSYEIEMFPEKNELTVKEGEVIGYVGNSGGSIGPHLHFEIRDEITEIPLNPLKLYKLVDTIKPICTAISLFDLKDSLNPALIDAIIVKSKKDSLYCVKDTLLLSKSILGFAFCGYDAEKLNGNPNSIYDAQLFIDDSLFYHHQMNYIPFDMANYVNEFCVEVNKKKFQKCFLPEIYPDNLYKKINNSGKIKLMDTLFHCVKFIFTDEYGTNNKLQFYIQTKRRDSFTQINYKSGNFINCRNEYQYSTKNFTFTIPPKGVYNYGFISVTDNFEKNKSFSILMPNSNMRLPGSVKIILTEKQLSLANKYILKNNNYVSVPKIAGNTIEYSFRSFGNFEMKTDTIGPEIKTLIQVKKIKKQIKTADKISFKVIDNLSGIATYFLFINNKWMSAEYDAKNDLITYYFDEETPKGKMEILLTVQDKAANISTYKLQIIR